MKQCASRVPGGMESRVATARPDRGCAIRWLARLSGIALLGLIQVCCLVWFAIPVPAQPKPKDTVKVTSDQMHQLAIVKVEMCQSVRDELTLVEKGGEITLNWRSNETGDMTRRKICVSTGRARQAWVDGR